MLRRLHPEQPESFEFTPANLAWAKEQMEKYPEGRQASAVIPILWRAQEQEGWVTRPMIEYVADLLDMDRIRVLEVASFYFMFQLSPVGRYHVQVCGTTSCMICGAEDLIGVCREKIGPEPHTVYRDGLFSWEEVECLGACANAPMAQIGKDYYEDLTAESLSEILDMLARGEVPTPGPQGGRYASEPKSGLTSLVIPEAERNARNASVELALRMGDTVKRITGEEPFASADMINSDGGPPPAPPQPAPGEPRADAEPRPTPSEEIEAIQPAALAEAINGKADDLQQLHGVGPAVERWLNEHGIFHFSQIAGWSDAELAWVHRNMPGTTRDDWRAQAGELDARERAERTPEHGGD
ncbi:MAG: NADH-quinone oxidoreductase subunit NuoE [Pseudomonadota bacterium]